MSYAAIKRNALKKNYSSAPPLKTNSFPHPKARPASEFDLERGLEIKNVDMRHVRPDGSMEPWRITPKINFVNENGKVRIIYMRDEYDLDKVSRPVLEFSVIIIRKGKDTMKNIYHSMVSSRENRIDLKDKDNSIISLSYKTSNELNKTIAWLRENGVVERSKSGYDYRDKNFMGGKRYKSKKSRKSRKTRKTRKTKKTRKKN